VNRFVKRFIPVVLILFIVMSIFAPAFSAYNINFWLNNWNQQTLTDDNGVIYFPTLPSGFNGDVGVQYIVSRWASGSNGRMTLIVHYDPNPIIGYVSNQVCDISVKGESKRYYLDTPFVWVDMGIVASGGTDFNRVWMSNDTNLPKQTTWDASIFWTTNGMYANVEYTQMGFLKTTDSTKVRFIDNPADIGNYTPGDDPGNGDDDDPGGGGGLFDFANILNAILNLPVRIASALKTFFDDLGGDIRNLPMGMNHLFANIWNSIDSMANALGFKLSDITDGIVNLPQNLRQFFQNIWEGIRDLPGNLKQFFDNVRDAVLGLPSSILDGIKSLFIPQEDHFGVLAQKFNEKFPIVLQLQQSINALLGYQFNETVPQFDLNIYGVNVPVIDLAFLLPYRPTVHAIIIGLAWIAFAIRMYHRLPGIIGGFGGWGSVAPEDEEISFIGGGGD